MDLTKTTPSDLPQQTWNLPAAAFTVENVNPRAGLPYQGPRVFCFSSPKFNLIRSEQRKLEGTRSRVQYSTAPQNVTKCVLNRLFLEFACKPSDLRFVSIRRASSLVARTFLQTTTKRFSNLIGSH